MSILLRSNLIELNQFLPGGSWRIHPTEKLYPWVNSAPICLSWHDSKDRYLWLADDQPDSVSSVEEISTGFGLFHQITSAWNAEDESLSKRVEFSLSSDRPVLMWRFSITNNSEEPVFLDRVTMLHTGIIDANRIVTSKYFPSFDRLQEGEEGLGFDRERSELAFYSNGWQSWNYAGTLSVDDPFPRTKLGPFVLPMRVNAGTPKSSRRGHCISDMFAVLGDRASRIGLLLGFTSQRKAFGTIEGWLQRTNPALQMWAHLDGVRLDPGQSFHTDWAYLQYINLGEREPLSDYFHIVAQSNHARVSRASRSGWSSWYYAYEDVSQAFIMENLEWVSSQKCRVPLDLFQIDDGYEKEVGDWFDLKDSFSDGLQHISSKIREAGLTPGIWLAPFVAKRGSELGRKRRDWILRNRMGIPVNPGFLWDSFPFVLDITHPGVLDHIQNVVERMVEEMGFEYLKLDFLYTGALPGKHHDPKLTRAQGLYQALEVIRHAAGEKVELLGCGIPLGSGIGVFDCMRIGPDVAPRWKPAHWGIEGLLDHEMGHPSTRNAILTTINRLPMHQRWWTNDPDCLLMRSTETHLSEAEVQTLASVIAMSGGALIVSDHLPALSEERVDWLARLIPPLPHAARAVDWFDTRYPSKLIMDLESPLGTWHLICLINWEDQAQDLVLDLNDFGLQPSMVYHVIDFWNQSHQRMVSSAMRFPQVPAHGVRMLSLRSTATSPQWLGDTLHISQGLFVREWDLRSDHLVCVLDPGRKVCGKVWIGMPVELNKIQIGDQEAVAEEIEAGVYQINVEFEGVTQLMASWK